MSRIAIVLFLLACALACNMVLYYQAKSVIQQQKHRMAVLQAKYDSLHSACTDPVVVRQINGMREWELKHGYR